MQNKHIELVENWLADNGSVSKEALGDNRKDAFLAAAYAVDVAAIIGDSTVALLSAAYAAADAAFTGTAATAAYWVTKYYKLVKKEQDNE